MDLYLRVKTSFKQLEGVVHDYGYLVFYTFNFSEVDDTLRVQLEFLSSCTLLYCKIIRLECYKA